MVDQQNRKLWLQGLHCFASHWKAWVIWAFCVGVISLLPVKLGGLLDLISILIFIIFYLKQEPFLRLGKFNPQKMVLLFLASFKIFFKIIPFYIISMVLINIAIISHKLGWEVPLANSYPPSIIPTIAGMLQVIGAIILYVMMKYFTFYMAELITLTSLDVQQPLEESQFINRGNWWRLSKNYLVLWILFAIPLYGIGFIDYYHHNLLVTLMAIVIFLITQGICAAFVYVAIRTFYHERAHQGEAS
jgi:hypothetical protein